MQRENKNRHRPSFPEVIRLLKKSGLNTVSNMEPSDTLKKKVCSLDRAERLNQLLDMLSTNISIQKPGYILVFVMYDIEDNRIRRYVSKYLERQGYIRVQKSIFFGNIKREINKEVFTNLKEINDTYQNGDSIIFLPVSQDIMHSLRLVGQNISFEVLIHDKNTLFI